jgi:hypothetical protein
MSYPSTSVRRSPCGVTVPETLIERPSGSAPRTDTRIGASRLSVTAYNRTSTPRAEAISGALT